MFILTAAFSLAGCNNQPSVTTFGDAGPAFDPVAFFDGHIQSWGIIEGRTGTPTGWVVTHCEGQADGPDRVHMVQHLSFQHGPDQQRTWTLWRTGPSQFQATASDMVGTATGQSDGRSFHWTWVLASAPGERLFDVTMDQWMFRLDDRAVMIRTTVSKLGIVLAQISEQFTTAGEPT
jgi:Protein of unknown function (DUF3833)